MGKKTSIVWDPNLNKIEDRTKPSELGHYFIHLFINNM